MPSEKLVPYKFEIYEHRNPDNKYNLTSLRESDTSFSENHLLDLLENLFNKQDTNLEPATNDKTFVIEEYHRDGNVIEGIVSTGYHGYEAEIRDVESGNMTHLKGEDEAEQMPLYFLIYLPQTTAGEPYEKGQTALIILHQVNRIGAKGKFKKHIKQSCLSGVTDYTMKMEPVTTEDVLEKVIEADRIAKLDLNVQKIPGDDESRMELVKGLSTEEVGTRSIVLRPKHGKSLDWVKRQAERFKNSEKHFGTIVGGDVENFSVTIQKDGGRSETFSLLNDEVAMRKDLDSEELRTDSGLITARSLRAESNELANDIFNQQIVESLTGSANVHR
ncbi:hypothetical protein B4589_012755 [Halolamina sp. CBA1230]|uniref:hypothetical protein n=1 Tax=Halolamina sp. CBA1230 TaxID=1853690 RepID=UPI0009A1B172|nr:hypothetical protein [Halolamina sp. CBA1230]QKY21201.1 hypothetical protein B4589_012755 [Halolamina sp. CBA1230]